MLQGQERVATAANSAPVAQTLAEPTLPVVHVEAGAQVADVEEAAAPPTMRERIAMWDRVMPVAFGVLGDETLTARTIFARVWARMSQEMRLAAEHLNERGGPGLLASKMGSRAAQACYFVHHDRRFSRLRVASPADGANGQSGALTELVTGRPAASNTGT